MQTASSASRTARVSRSASEKATTEGTPNSRQARTTRRAISPRLATRILLNMGLGTAGTDLLVDRVDFVLHGGWFVAALVDLQGGTDALRTRREDGVVHRLAGGPHRGPLAFKHGAH